MSAGASDAAALAGVGIVSALTLELLGLPIQPILWGFVGGLLGVSLAKKTSFPYACAVYFCSSLASALAGYELAKKMGWSPGVGNALAATTGLAFHPLSSAFLLRVPALFDAILSAVSRRGSP